MVPYNNEVVSVYIIDVSQLLYRGSCGGNDFFNCGDLTIGEDGVLAYEKRINIGGIKFVLNRLRKYLAKGTVCLAFDSENIIKKSSSEAYKAGRGTGKVEMNIKEQSRYLYRVLSQLGYNCYKEDGYEADDVMQSLTYQLLSYEYIDKIYLVNTDTDLYHLCNSPKVKFCKDGTKNRPDEYFGVDNPIKGRAPKYSLYDRLVDGKRSNNILKLQTDDAELRLRLQVLGTAIEQGICSAEIASDPIAFKEYTLSKIGSYDLVLDRMYLLYPQVLDWVDFKIDFSNKRAVSSQMKIQLEEEDYVQ